MAFGFSKSRDGKIASVSTKDVVGALFNAPNTAVGVAYGSVGDAIGEAAYAMGLPMKRPRVAWRDGGVQFTNNPFGGLGAITSGDVTVWRDDPWDPRDTRWHTNGVPDLENGHTYPEHEKQHRLQGQQLGPLYLPSNLLGGLNALAHGQDWHGDRNWNERGPQLPVARPWAPRSR
jgi:hypothetical protein